MMDREISSMITLDLLEKQDLQQNLRTIGTQLKSELVEIIDQKELEPEPLEINLMAELIKNLPKPKKSEDEAREHGSLQKREWSLKRRLRQLRHIRQA